MCATENDITGQSLVALLHEDLKEMGIGSVGHRLTILKSVYEIKIKQDVRIESDHYVPLCKSGIHLVLQRCYDRMLVLTLRSCRCRGTVCHSDAQGYQTTGGAVTAAGRADEHRRG